MKKEININVASFYESDYKQLSWSIEGSSQSGTSTLDEQHYDKIAISNAVEKHLQQISKSLPEGDNFSDYEMSLLFEDGLEAAQKEEFTAAFNDSNTRDESF
ncbi:hypothetical protein M8998_07655 [Sphingobacterium sp. lm-10]|uniref:hypothetical protein n=1 Tax=Sphingobacterium sp. lm-10 TaxID=2944904 RepID=UPI002021E389|nr:hypothetical protein [Sphingobacterium sp. lm-10]MCL7987811.1 hypothetical protein [Sphingobacterium sp. lm-10]